VASARGAADRGIIGAHVFISASSQYDVWVYNSSSVALTDHYTETAHSNAFLSGDGVSGPGRVAISAAKLNLNSPAYPAAVVNDYAGLFFHTGSIASYSIANVSVGGTAPVDVVWVGESFWVNATAFAVSNHNARLTLLGNTYVPNTPPFAPDIKQADSLALIAQGFDAFRELSYWDIALNYPELL
jgi:hypothetical protein